MDSIRRVVFAHSHGELAGLRRIVGLLQGPAEAFPATVAFEVGGRGTRAVFERITKRYVVYREVAG
jgi:hypothetical protein